MLHKIDIYKIRLLKFLFLGLDVITVSSKSTVFYAAECGADCCYRVSTSMSSVSSVSETQLSDGGV